MKTAKFIAVFLCGAIVMTVMSCTRSACTMSHDTPADITTPTDVISAETEITVETTSHTTTEQTTAPTDSLTTSATSTTTTASRTTTTAKTTTSTTRTSTAQTTAKTTTKPTTTAATTTTRTTSTAKPTKTTTQSTTRSTTTTAATTTTTTATATTASTFDISKYSTYAMSYGQSIGLIYDSGVSSFDTPLILSSSTTSPEKRIRDRQDGYAASGYTRFKVWTEYRESDGKWKLYIAYG